MAAGDGGWGWRLGMSEPWVAESVDELVRGATDRRAVRSSDAKSGASFETLTIGGRACFLKVLSADSDWIMRCTGNRSHWEFTVWRAGLYQDVPAVIDPAMIGMALDETQTRAAAVGHADARLLRLPGPGRRRPDRRHPA